MTNEELVALIQAGTDVNSNLAQLYQQNRNFIYKTALPYSSTCEMDDLMQEAYFGVAEAAQRYQPDKDVLFITYVGFWIKSKVQRYCENCGRIKRIPAHILTLISKYRKITTDYQKQHGNEPTDQEYCGYLGVSQSRLDSLRKYMMESTMTSLDALVPGTEDMVLGAVIPDGFDLEGHVVEEMATEQGKRALWGAVAELGDRPRAIIEGRYRGDMSLDAIGTQHGITRERVRQLEINAIRQLRHNQRIREAAMLLDYGSYGAYHWGVQRFKDTGTSSTEAIAIKNIEREEMVSRQNKKLDETIRQLEYQRAQIDIKRAEFNAEVEAFWQTRRSESRC